MTTLRWENRPVQQTVQTWVGEEPKRFTIKEPSFHSMTHELAPPLPLVLLQKAQERLDLMDELRDARADRDRYIARCAELERRLEAIRGVLR